MYSMIIFYIPKQLYFRDKYFFFKECKVKKGSKTIFRVMLTNVLGDLFMKAIF